jgi:branched-chain amino acid transport system substrate-binding protein
MGDSFAAAFRLYMEQAHVQCPTVTRPVLQGYGGAYRGTQELLGLGVDVIVAGLSTPVARWLTPLVEERQVPMVVANVGGHVLDPAQKSPYVVHNSLLYWQGSFAMGRWSAQHIGRRAFLASSRADSGYDTIFAFRSGFESAGGSVVGSGVTHEKASSGLPELIDQIRAANPALVFANYTGAARVDFLHAYARSGLRTALVGPTFLAEDFEPSALSRATAHIRTATSWINTDPSDANQAFRTAYRAATGREADAFAVLGYDTAILVVTAFRQAQARGLARSRIGETLAGASIASPRGTLTVDGTTNSVTGPLHVRRVTRVPGAGSRYLNTKVATLYAITGIPAPLQALDLQGRSAYFNEILCA